VQLFQRRLGLLLASLEALLCAGILESAFQRVQPVDGKRPVNPSCRQVGGRLRGGV
jgi:hypothetical protein